jgi:hypothetical protein
LDKISQQQKRPENGQIEEPKPSSNRQVGDLNLQAIPGQITGKIRPEIPREDGKPKKW